SSVEEFCPEVTWKIEKISVPPCLRASVPPCLPCSPRSPCSRRRPVRRSTVQGSAVQGSRTDVQRETKTGVMMNSMKKSDASESQSASELISKRIADLGDWRGKTLGRIRTLIKEADPDVVEEWKWVKATNPGTPVWSHDG